MRRLAQAFIAIIFTVLALALFAAAFGGCEWGYDDQEALPPTFGDGAVQMSYAYCEARVECGWDTTDMVAPCVDGNLENLCERWDCLLDLPEAYVIKFDACVADLAEWNCGPFLPVSCYEVLELR